ncbi:MAG: MBL fold metallo-hydrolase [Candidatus Uhrbacteria bacterium]
MSESNSNTPSRLSLRRFLKLTTIVPIVVLVIASAQLLARATISSDDNNIVAPRVVVLDVGQGDAILADGPGDAEILIDGGPSPNLSRQLRRYLGRDRTIDLVVLTHPHADHLVGLLGVLKEYDVGRVIITGAVHTTPEYEQFLKTLLGRGIPTTVAVAGQAYDIGPFHLDVLYPFDDFTGRQVEDLNASSIVAMLTVATMTNDEIRMTNQARNSNDEHLDTRSSGVDSTSVIRTSSSRMLLTGDAPAEVETQILARYGVEALRAAILKVGHHGSDTATSAAFLEAVRPAHAIISVGQHNDYGHPSRRTIKHLERIGAQAWRTDEQGNIVATFTPTGLSVTSER